MCAPISAPTIDRVGFGSSPYGISSYGGVLGSISVAAAWAISTHGVRVELTSEPQHADPFDPGDALNVATWMVEPIGYAARTVIGATMHDDQTVDLTLLEALENHSIPHQVSALGLLGFGGIPATNPLTASFVGIVQTLDPVEVASAEGYRDRDLANPPFQAGRRGAGGSAMIIGPDGDYDTEAGVALYRKLLVRRLSTPRGSIRHLPRYGIGLQEKEPVASAGDLAALSADIEAQARQEPDIVAATARLLMDPSGVLVVWLDARPRNGAVFSVRMGAANGRLVEF